MDCAALDTEGNVWLASSNEGLVRYSPGCFASPNLAAGLTEPGEEAYARTWKANAAGVDLNRNFDAGWELLDGRSAPSAEGWRGSAPV